MERRYNPRIAIQNKFLIHVRQSTFVSGVIKNLSKGGLALEAVDSARLKKNLVVRVAFKVNRRLVILPSLVVRVADEEAALLFTDESSRHRQIFRSWFDHAVHARTNSSAAELKQPMQISVSPPT